MIYEELMSNLKEIRMTNHQKQVTARLSLELEKALYRSHNYNPGPKGNLEGDFYRLLEGFLCEIIDALNEFLYPDPTLDLPSKAELIEALEWSSSWDEDADEALERIKKDQFKLEDLKFGLEILWLFKKENCRV
jgi:hypothetical protein